MAKYTDEQIKKALECCGSPTTTSKLSCNNCPLLGARNCMVLVNRFALDLIKRQEAEVERLQKENNRFADIGKMYSEIKSEAIKEFAERLKKSAFDCDVSFGFGREHYTEAVTVFEIENLVEEMVGEGE